MSTMTATELSKSLIDQISVAITDAPDAASARQLLSDRLKEQGSEATASAAEVLETPSSALVTEAKTVLRPNGTEYHVRKIGDHSDVAALKAARVKGINILAYGPPGTGKTALIEGAFTPQPDEDSTGRIYTVQGSGDTETADFIGGYVQLPTGLFSWVDGPLLRAMEEGSVLYIDEISLIDPKVLSIVYGVMDGRDELFITANPERGVVKAAEGFYVVAACNPNAPGSRMSEALTSRFALQFQVTTDYSLARRLGVPKTFITAAQNLERKREKGEVGWSPQMRECLAFLDLVSLLGQDVALRNTISTAPEIDRPVVTDVLSRAFSKSLGELQIT